MGKTAFTASARKTGAGISANRDRTETLGQCGSDSRQQRLRHHAQDEHGRGQYSDDKTLTGSAGIAFTARRHHNLSRWESYRLIDEDRFQDDQIVIERYKAA